MQPPHHERLAVRTDGLALQVLPVAGYFSVCEFSFLWRDVRVVSLMLRLMQVQRLFSGMTMNQASITFRLAYLFSFLVTVVPVFKLLQSSPVFMVLPWAFAVIKARMQNDRPLVLTAVQQNWRALQYASIRLRGDRDVVLEDLLSCIIPL